MCVCERMELNGKISRVESTLCVNGHSTAVLPQIEYAMHVDVYIACFTFYMNGFAVAFGSLLTLFHESFT